MLRNAILALIPVSMLAAGPAAQAFEVLGQGENFAVAYDNPAHNVVGGGAIAVTQQGEAMSIQYAEDAPHQPGRIAQFVSHGEAGIIRYLPVPPASDSLTAGMPSSRG